MDLRLMHLIDARVDGARIFEDRTSEHDHRPGLAACFGQWSPR